MGRLTRRILAILLVASAIGITLSASLFAWRVRAGANATAYVQVKEAAVLVASRLDAAPDTGPLLTGLRDGDLPTMSAREAEKRLSHDDPAVA